MRTPPDDLLEGTLVALLDEGWGIAGDRIDHLPVGFGSHHWLVEGGGGRWFVTVDDLDARRIHRDESRVESFDRLGAALATARALADRGLAFVVAPLPDRTGAVVRPLVERYAVAVYPFVVGSSTQSGEYGSPAERRKVLDLVVPVHGVDPSEVPARRDDLAVPLLDALMAALDELGRPWDSGPYGEQARARLDHHARAVDRSIATCDRRSEPIRARTERFVLTHGEPHPGNVMTTAGGRRLVDWDTALVAPPERDLWTIAGSDRTVLDAYTAATGRRVLDDTIDHYRRAWDLTEIALYVALLRLPHTDTADVRESWRNLETCLSSVDDEDRHR